MPKLGERNIVNDEGGDGFAGLPVDNGEKYDAASLDHRSRAERSDVDALVAQALMEKVADGSKEFVAHDAFFLHGVLKVKSLTVTFFSPALCGGARRC